MSSRMLVSVSLCVLCLSNSLHAQALSHLWSKRFGAVGNQMAFDITADGFGNVLLAGYFSGTVDFGGGPLMTSGNAGDTDIFVAKLDAAGNHLWSYRFGDAAYQGGYTISIAVDEFDNVFLAGFFQGTVDFGGGPMTNTGGSDIFVAKFDASGTHLWSYRFGDAGQEARAWGIAIDGFGNVLLTGDFGGAVDFGGGLLTSAGGKDIWAAKFTTGGTHVWSKRFGDSSPAQWGLDVDVASSGNFFLTGSFEGSVDFGGGLLTSAGQGDIFVAEFDATGTHLWSKRFGDIGEDRAYSIAVNDAGSAVLAGSFNGSVNFGGGPLTSAGAGDIFVAKFDGAGNHLWSQRFGDAGNNAGFDYSIAVDGVGNVALTGWLYGTVDFGGGPLTSAGNYDIFVAKFDANGTHLWSQRFGDALDQQTYGLGVRDENVLLTGRFSLAVDFGGGPLTSAGDYDIFVVNLKGDCPVAASGDLLFAELYTTEADTINLSLGEAFVYTTNYFEITRQANEALYLSGSPNMLDSLVYDDDIHINGQGIGGGPYIILDNSFPRGVPIETVLQPIPAQEIPESIIPEGTGCYTLDLVDTQREIFGNTNIYLVKIAIPTGIPTRAQDYSLVLNQNYPNPFNPVTTISYSLPKSGIVNLDVYDVTGRLVRSIVSRAEPSGNHITKWDGHDANGEVVSSGVYFVRLELDRNVRVRKVVLLK